MTKSEGVTGASLGHPVVNIRQHCRLSFMRYDWESEKLSSSQKRSSDRRRNPKKWIIAMLSESHSNVILSPLLLISIKTICQINIFYRSSPLLNSLPRPRLLCHESSILSWKSFLFSFGARADAESSFWKSEIFSLVFSFLFLGTHGRFSQVDQRSWGGSAGRATGQRFFLLPGTRVKV